MLHTIQRLTSVLANFNKRFPRLCHRIAQAYMSYSTEDVAQCTKVLKEPPAGAVGKTVCGSKLVAGGFTDEEIEAMKRISFDELGKKKGGAFYKYFSKNIRRYVNSTGYILAQLESIVCDTLVDELKEYAPSRFTALLESRPSLRESINQWMRPLESGARGPCNACGARQSSQSPLSLIVKKSVFSYESLNQVKVNFLSAEHLQEVDGFDPFLLIGTSALGLPIWRRIDPERLCETFFSAATAAISHNMGADSVSYTHLRAHET